MHTTCEASACSHAPAARHAVVKFQNVDKLTLYISSNQGDEESTALSGIKLWGTGLTSTNMKDFKRVAGEKGEGE